MTWHGDHALVLDQTALPATVRFIEVRTPDDMIDVIERLVIRGAPALAVAGAFGIALAVLHHERGETSKETLLNEVARIRSARPTAVNLAWGVDHVLPAMEGGSAAVIAAAEALAERDAMVNGHLAQRGARFVAELCGPKPFGIQTHCHTGSLACIEWGTALGIIRVLHDMGMVEHVYVGETRPLLQGSRLTSFELMHLGVPHSIVVDGAGPSMIARGDASVVIVGADCITANGDVVNKIGTYPLALAAWRAEIPFIVSAPEATIDESIASGSDVKIEMRDPNEVLSYAGQIIAPLGAKAINPAFDITPADLVTAIVTEDRILRPDRAGLQSIHQSAHHVSAPVIPTSSAITTI
ncbi:MAG: S-methyl-5-thioribose-1-phosphate isomerase [Ilumatobacteraceae bacterium]